MTHSPRPGGFPTGQYRVLENIMKLINSSCRPYLATFSTILFAVVSLLLFGAIRVWHQDPGSNLMFPACGLRCFYEGITPLMLSGEVVKKNKKVIAQGKQIVYGRWILDQSRKRKLEKVWLNSCHGLRCEAGSLFTFENSIVIISLHNTMQLTLNFLVTF